MPASPSSTRKTSVYVMRSTLRMTPRVNSCATMSPLPIDLEQSRQNQPVFLRAQRTDVCRKLNRQHGYRAVREIDAGAAQLGFRVNGRPRLYVMAHVGDVDLQREMAVRQIAPPRQRRRNHAPFRHRWSRCRRSGNPCDVQSRRVNLHAECARACSMTSGGIHAADDACE